MKKLIVVALAMVFSVAANANSFMCKDYTDNEVDSSAATFEEGLKSDNPIRSAVTHVRVNPDGYTVVQNDVFKKQLTFTSARFKQGMDKYASSPKGMIFKKIDGDGNPYFIILTTAKDEKVGEKPKDNPLTRMVTLGNCSER